MYLGRAGKDAEASAHGAPMVEVFTSPHSESFLSRYRKVY